MNPSEFSSEFGTDSVARLERVLDRIVASPEREREWIDLLSQLEYVGARKIMKSLSYEEISLEVLQHVAEEAAHAHQLKALIARDAADDCSWATARLSEFGWRYFQTLDQTASRIPQVAGMNYPAVSWIVEQRVLDVYPRYLAKTTNEDLKRVLTRILAQERRHGDRFDGHSYPEGLKHRLLQIEQKLWDEFLESVERHFSDGQIPFYPALEGNRIDPDVSATD